jgi:replicative DNA helicase Mcm
MSEVDNIDDIFKNFLDGFRDSGGVRVYDEKIHEMPLSKKRSLIINYDDLKEFNEELTKSLTNNPEDVLFLFNETLFGILARIDVNYAGDIESCFIRISDLNKESLNLREVKSSHLNSLIRVKGIVVRMTSVKPQIKIGRFRCNNTSSHSEEKIDIRQRDNFFTKPIRCTNPNCNNTNSFTFLPDESVYRDWQKIRIQELPEQLPAGQMPRYIECILLDDLVDVVRPGDRVVVTGISKALQDYGKRGKLTTFNPYLFVNFIEKTEKGAMGEIELTDEEIEEIKEMSKSPTIFEDLSSIIASVIRGHNLVKKALLLSLVSGVRKELDTVNLRGDIHVLIIGDPGIGKSQICKVLTSISPRGLYTSGKGNTKAGLTAAVITDKDTGERILEAGALVIADKGVCCIDEFTQMSDNDKSSIHEVMEQQTISIHKAGISANLNALTTIIATANPTWGRYDEMKTIKENIKKLNPVILTRFDLIFILRDIPNQNTDKEIADHVLRIHQKRQVDTVLSIDKFRKYIYYAKKNFSPVLTDEALKIISEFYIKTRDTSSYAEDEDAPVPITARYLESTIRLAEARAKIELSETVKEEHAKEAIDILKFSLQQIGIDKDTGRLDMDVIETGMQKSQKSKMDSLLSLIKSMVRENLGEPVKITEVVEEADKLNFNKANVEKFIKILGDEGMIYNPSTDTIKQA